MKHKKELKKQAKLELARRNFYDYCCLKAPDFYTKDRKYLKELCDELQSFYFSQDEIMVINIPPRHGKSRTIGCFVEWVLGRNSRVKIITGSYNETLSKLFSKSVRNTVSEQKSDKNKIVYSEIFPGAVLKKGDGAANFWSLDSGYNNYLATSPLGTATGFGADLIVIDDLIKSAYEANNAQILEGHWEWYTDTLLSRLEEGGKVIIIMTRWHTGDLAGRALAHYDKARLFTRRAHGDNGKMLCPAILSAATFDKKKKIISPEIIEANYQQEPIDVKGRLYGSFKTYDKPPTGENGELLFSEICNYTDTADTGADYLCGINYGVYNGEAYVLDVLFSKERMESTEIKLAEMLFEGNVNRAFIESNNGGRAFARNVERLISDKYGSNRCKIETFHQSKNKQSRIISNSSWVTGHIYFPVNWKDRFYEFFKSLNEYQRDGKNAHDDAADAVTGIAERLSRERAFSFR
ncbi:MAG: phage terminase large subunit [Oscillospiraceae bacterium]|nr:phage terminase large subunit [Oscillospiraceae bacterium]